MQRQNDGDIQFPRQEKNRGWNKRKKIMDMNNIRIKIKYLDFEHMRTNRIINSQNPLYTFIDDRSYKWILIL